MTTCRIVQSHTPPIPNTCMTCTYTCVHVYTQVNSIVQERHSKVSFNVSWLEDLYEETLVEISGERVTPLVTNPGRIMLTSSRIYFQPYNNVEVVRGRSIVCTFVHVYTCIYVSVAWQWSAQPRKLNAVGSVPSKAQIIFL